MKSSTLIALSSTLFAFIACTNGGSGSGADVQASYSTEAEAQAASPIGQACLLSGDINETCVPRNRGKNGKCTETTTDTRVWEPGYARGDVDFNGTIGDRADAQLATKRIYVKQIESTPCPAAADIAAFEGVGNFWSPDGYLTSNDINNWREVHKTGNFQLQGDVICKSQCSLINHMAPGNK